MVKLCQTRLLKLNFETIQKTHFPVLAKNSAGHDEVEIFFCQFPNPWTLRVSGMGCYTSKCEKSQNHCTVMNTLLLWNPCILPTSMPFSGATTQFEG
jgi:hypothetical protein